jgi:predicted dehydrogenase
MSDVSRRNFIKGTMAVGAGLIMATPFSKVRGANDTIRIGVIGVGGQGGGHCKYFNNYGARVVAVCDADESHLAQHVNNQVDGYKDMRQLLDRDDIDAVTSATPNHWHSLVTVWACQAGKDVYIEKPVCHEIWEGRKMVEAARKYNRVVQTGTQKRSSTAHKEAFEWIHAGNIGAIKWARGFCYKARHRGTNGIVNATNGPNLAALKGVDYNLWCGPADMEPLIRRELHYKWHWVWNTGCGDLGNQGIHEMDLARWALGDPGFPEHVISIGGRFDVFDAGETANTQIVYFDYKPAPLIFEVQGLPRAKGARGVGRYRGIDIGIVVQCEEGYFAAGDGGGWIYDNDGNQVKQFSGQGGGKHHENFVQAVRDHNVEELNADIEKGFISSSLCHMGNISYRLGAKKSADDIKTAIGDNADLMDSFDRMLEHLNVNEVNLENEPITIGPMLTMDPEKEQFTGEYGDFANMFVKRNYREPFVVPKQV